MTDKLQSYLSVAGVILLVWTLIALLFTQIIYLANLDSAQPVPWMGSLHYNLLRHYVWALLTPLVFLFARRFPLERRERLITHLVLHLCFAVAIGMAQVYLQWLAEPHIIPEEHQKFYSWYLVRHAGTNTLYYLIMVIADLALRFYKQSQERAYRLVQARLQALKMQLHPHFLFNTLNAIAELGHRDAKLAEQTVTRLANLLRTTIEAKDLDFVSLNDELDFIAQYLEIQRTLLEERLTVVIDVSPKLRQLAVPSLILQPLIENALVHGLADRKSGGRIDIRARQLGDKLHLEVQDNGLGLPPDWREGVGIGNSRVRLALLYGSAQQLTVENVSPQGVRVGLVLPAMPIAETRAIPTPS